jgi:peptide/nickel transport system substrate-binding protein
MANQKTWQATYMPRRVNRRAFIGGTAAGIAGAALLACGGGDSSSTPQQITIDPSGVRKPGNVVYAKDNWKLADETKAAVPGGVLTRRNEQDLTESMDPLFATQGRGDRFTDFGYEYLVIPNRGPGIDPNSAEGQALRPHLAESFESSNDGMTYTFKLRPNVKFHNIAPVNGRVMDIDDWRTTHERYIALSVNRDAFLEVVDKATFPDRNTMVMTLKEPYAPFMSRMWDYNFAWKVIPKELNANPELLARQMIGTSWRMVDKVQPSVTWEFKRHDDYWAGKPFIDRWHWPLIPEAANAYAQFVAQNVIDYTPNARDALRLRGDAPQAIMTANEIANWTVNRSNFGKIEAGTSPWKDPRVRIALHKIMPWDAYLELESNVKAFRAAGVEPELAYTTHLPWNPAYFLDPRKNELGEASKNYMYDVAAAKQLMSAAGFPDGIDIDYQSRAGNAAAAEISTVQLDEWAKSGIVRANRVNNTAQVYGDKIVALAEFKGLQYPASSSGTDVDYLLYRNYHSAGPPNPWTGPLADKVLDDLVVKQRKEPDWNKRVAVIKDIQMHVAKTFPLLPGSHRFSTWRFEWPWLHNVNQPYTNRSWPDDSRLQWLDPNMPRRNG